MSADAKVSFGVEAIDEASDVIRDVGGVIEDTGDIAEETNKKTSRSFGDVYKSLDGVITSVNSIYLGWDKVQNSTLAVDKANLKVSTSLQDLNDKTEAAAAAVEKYGQGSKEANEAQLDLDQATERYRISLENANNAQNNVTQAMLGFGTSVVPSLTSAVDDISGLFGEKGILGSIGGLKGGLTDFVGNFGTFFTSPLGLALAGVGLAIGLAIIAWQDDFGGFRTFLTNLWNDLIAYFDAIRAEAERAQRALEALSRAKIEAGVVTPEIVSGMEPGKRKYFTELMAGPSAAEAAAASIFPPLVITNNVTIEGVIDRDLIDEVGERLAEKMNRQGVR